MTPSHPRSADPSALDVGSHPHIKPTLPYRALAVICLTLTIYGSLLPFQFATPDNHNNIITTAHHQLQQLRWHVGPNSDLALNLILYIPAGLLLRLAIRRRCGNHLHQLAVPIIIVAAASFLVEFTQTFMPFRFSSTTDITLNVTGAAAATWVFTTIRITAIAAHDLGRRTRHPLIPILTRPLARLILPTTMVAGVTAIYLSGHPATHAAPDRANFLPFLHQFLLPYDQAVLALAITAAAYALAALMIRVALLTLARRFTHRAAFDAAVIILAALFAIAAASR
ncbi:MAG: hypothetical protein CMJ49_13445, partial [Planctomycetaceae bacterium]|nr:hypothetical protein [Planctomycetaceae bacterium]